MKNFLVLSMLVFATSFAIFAQESASVKKATPVTTIKPLETEKVDKGNEKAAKACCKGKSAKECSKGKNAAHAGKSCSSTASASAEGAKPACCAAKEGKSGCQGAKVEKAEEVKPAK
jgi:hypothetical protein